METAYVVLLSFFVIFAIHRLLSRRHSSRNTSTKQQLPPGPLAIPVLGHLHLLEKKTHHAFMRLAARYGPVLYLRLGSRAAVVVCSAEVARECLTEHDATFATRPSFPTLSLLTFGGTTVGTSKYGAYWRHIRRVITVHLLSAQRVRSMFPAMEAEARVLARSLYRAAAATAPGGGGARVEMRARQFEVSLSTLMETIVQTKTSRDADTGMSPEAREFKESMDAMVPLSSMANIADILPVLQRLDVFGVRKKAAAAVSGRDAFFRRLIDAERRKLRDEDDDGVASENKSMMALLLTLQKSDPENYSDDMIMALCFSMFSAGTETTASAGEWAMSLLLNHPEVLKKAQGEIDEHVGNSRLVRADDMPRLRYLQCIITETLRLYPVLPMLVAHESLADCTVGGYHVPGGTMLLINAYAIHRDPAVWTDPDVFRPERFEDGSAQGKFMIPFGMGRRKCPGETMALRTLELVLGTLIQCFDWATVGGAPKVDMTEAPGLSLPRAVPLEAKCKPRQVMLDVLQKL